MAIGREEAEAFVGHWLNAWNSHDLEAILAHFHDEVIFTSPLAARLVPESEGVIRGKAALRSYWAVALSRVPALHFTLTGICTGHDLIVIQFRNEQGQNRAEILRLRDGLAFEGHGTYAI